MKKRDVNRNVMIWIVLVILLFLGSFLLFRITGNIISTEESEAGISVTRLISESYNSTDIRLGIISSENVLAVQEQILGENCSVINYSLDSYVEIFEFNSDNIIWLIANNSNSLIVNLYYSIPKNCIINDSAGVVYTLSEENLSSYGFNVSVPETPSVPSTPSSGSGGGGGGGSSSSGGVINKSSEVIKSTPIVQARDKEEFDSMLLTALDKLAGKENPAQTVDRKSFMLYLALIGIAIIIILIFIVLFLRKPKSSDEFFRKLKESNSQA